MKQHSLYHFNDIHIEDNILIINSITDDNNDKNLMNCEYLNK